VVLRTIPLKCQIQDYQNKDKLSVYRILLLQRKPKPGHTKPSTGSHGAHGLDIAGLDDPQPWLCFVEQTLISHSLSSHVRHVHTCHRGVYDEQRASCGEASLPGLPIKRKTCCCSTRKYLEAKVTYVREWLTIKGSLHQFFNTILCGLQLIMVTNNRIEMTPYLFFARSGVSKLWPAGQIQPVMPFHPADEKNLSMMKN